MIIRVNNVSLMPEEGIGGHCCSLPLVPLSGYTHLHCLFLAIPLTATGACPAPAHPVRVYKTPVPGSARPHNLPPPHILRSLRSSLRSHSQTGTTRSQHTASPVVHSPVVYGATGRGSPPPLQPHSAIQITVSALQI